MSNLKPYRVIGTLTMNGKRIKPGAAVMLDQRRAVWLAEQGVVEVPGVTVRKQPAVAAPKSSPIRRCCGWR
jgi:hypothetical protein